MVLELTTVRAPLIPCSALEQLQAKLLRLEGIEAECVEAKRARSKLEDALHVKEKMLDDQNETIAGHKVGLSCSACDSR